MTYDRAEAASLAITMSLHLLMLLLFSGAIIKSNPQKAALITDVTLIDTRDYRGEKGEEEKTAGIEKKQEKTAESLEKKKVKKAKLEEKKESVPDIKALLAKIEKEKEKLSMGIKKENLRSIASDEEIREEHVEEETEETGVIAGSDPAITGQIASRSYKKINWKFPEKLPEETELMIEITVLSSGIIKDVKLVRASGYPQLDRMALSQARKLEFEPLPLSNKEQAGVLLFKFGAEK